MYHNLSSVVNSPGGQADKEQWAVRQAHREQYMIEFRRWRHQHCPTRLTKAKLLKTLDIVHAQACKPPGTTLFCSENEKPQRIRIFLPRPGRPSTGMP
eukprot:1337868-Lingulodinium_polyedra.AAC.1